MKKILGYVPFALLVLLVYLSFLVIRPFISTIIGAFIVAYIFYPLYNRLEKKTGRRNLAAFLVSVLLVVILTIPVVFILNSVVSEANTTYLMTKRLLDDGLFPDTTCGAGDTSIVCTVAEKTNNMVTGTTLKYYIRESSKRLALFFTESAGKMIVAIPSAIIDFFLMLFIVFFALRDGKLFFQKLDSIIPLQSADRERIFGGIKNMTFGVIYGSVIVALIQGVVGGIGFFLFGITSPIIWGIVMGLLAFIPLVGPLLIWLPAALMLLFGGLSAGDKTGILRGIGLIIYGILFISSVENILKPMIIGNKVKTHPIIIIVGVLGGLHAFGILGLVVGPLVLELLITFVGIVREHYWTRRKGKARKL